MLTRGNNREAFLQTRARWEAAGELAPASPASEREDGARPAASGTRTLPSRGRRARLRRSDSRDSLDDGRPSHDSPPPPSRDSATKGKHKSPEKRRKSSTKAVNAEERSSIIPLLELSDKPKSSEKRRKSSTTTAAAADVEERSSIIPLLELSDAAQLSGGGATPEPIEPRRRSSRSGRRSGAAAAPDPPDRRVAADRQRAEPAGRDEEAGKRRLSRTPSLGARDKPALWSAERDDVEKTDGLGDSGGDAEYRPSRRAALGIGTNWGGSLNRLRMPRSEAAAAVSGGSRATGFQLPTVISGRLARQTESFVSSSPDLSRELFAPAEGRASPRTGRRDLDEILERAARRRSSRQAAGGSPLLTARALFTAEPRSGRAESVDRWERGSEGRPEPDAAGGRPWPRVRRDSDTSDASSAAGRSSSSGVPETDSRPERPPASPLVAGSAAAARRAGFRPRAGSEGGILDEPDPDSVGGGGGWRSATQSWLTLGSRSAEAVEDAVETSSVSSGGTDRKSASRNWLAQGRLDVDDAASETASVGSSGSGRRKWISRGSISVEPAEETTGGTGQSLATPPTGRSERQEPAPAPSPASVNSRTPVLEEAPDALVNDHVADKQRHVQNVSRVRLSAVRADAEDDRNTAEDFASPGDRSTLLRQKLAALRTGASSEREADKTQDKVAGDDRASQLRQKVAALTPETDSQSPDSKALADDSSENRATLLRKKIAAMKKSKPDGECDEDTTQDIATEENRATALRQKMAGLRPNSLALPAAGEADSKASEVRQIRSPLTPRSPRPAERPSPSEDGPGAGGVSTTPAEETSRSRPTGRAKPAIPNKPTADSGRPPTDRSPATPRGSRPRSAVRRTSSLTGRDSSWRSRSRSPVKGRIATLRLKPRGVSQSPDPLDRWRSMEDVLSSPAGPVSGGSDASWEPQSGAVEPEPSPPEQADPVKSGLPPSAESTPPLPPARPPRRRRSGPQLVKERVDENRNQICAESSESREESSSSPPSSPPSSPTSSPTLGRPATEKTPAAGDAWLAGLVPAGRQRTSSESSCDSLGSFDLERELLSEEGPAPGLPRQLVSVKSDLIAFSPGKEPAEASSTPPATAAAAPASDLSSATPPTPFSAAAAAADSNVSQLLKKQELHFQDQLLKRDREMTAMKNANAKLIQQAGNNKPEKLLERSTHLLVMLTKENGQLRRELKTRLPQLAAERDEARQEVANAEAMFADLHRKYEKSKSVLQEHRRCAEQNDGACQEARERAVREKQRYDMLQQHSEDAHSRLQADLEVAEKGHKTELLTLKAKLQLAENREAKLERENREITAICDELIQKMGGAH